ncbi:hypothetical protein T459_29717 [Capsicum annuum]|uniref:Uncharacterized protein n=1 Tax=Capsicum annuum TaxID=4072 RepID=A0A2G2Y6E3_CAPAN|nr:hypothetical protein T459_29717 [Capsicum annuum]
MCSPDGKSIPGGHGSPNENDRKRLRRLYQSKTFKVEISFAAKILMQSITNALCGQKNNGNSSPGGHGCPNETDMKRLRRPYQSKKIQDGDQFCCQNPNAETTSRGKLAAM